MTPSGELDLASAPELEAEVERAWDSQLELVIVDLRCVEFMDTAGPHLIMTANHYAHQADRRFAIVDGGEQVHMLLSLTGVLDIVTVIENPDVLLL